MLAFYSGQTLAALFLLRVLVEQFVRRSVSAGPDEMADSAIERYMETLPKDFRGRFPSLREIYASLSEAIHQARADDQLLTLSAQRIVTHFDALRLFRQAEGWTDAHVRDKGAESEVSGNSPV